MDDKITLFVTEQGLEEQIVKLLVEKTGLNNKAFEVRVIDAIPVKSSGKIDYPEMQRMIEMSKRICEQNGFLSEFEQTVGEKGDILRSLTISTDKDGNLQFFAELEKLSEKQRERIEENREKKQAEKKDVGDKDVVKSTTLQASSEEELIKRFKEFNWDSIPDKEQETKPVIEYRI